MSCFGCPALDSSLFCLGGLASDSLLPCLGCLVLLQVLGEGIIDDAKFREEVEAMVSRDATQAELKTLQKYAFVGPHHNGKIILVKLEDLAWLLKGLAVQGISATLACLEDLPPLEGSSAGRSSTSIFPDTIPQCPVGEEELWGPYSLTATAGQLAAKGTKWDKQLAALEKFKTKPPLSSHGRVSKVGPTSMELMMRSLDEYVGYAQKHHGVSPSMDLVMQPNMFCKFMAFKLARGNAASTMLRTAQQVSLVVPFVLSGHCPQVQSWTPGHAAQVKQWFSNLKAGFRQESASTPAKRSDISLGDQWEAVDAEWTNFMQDFQVGVVVMCFALHCLALGWSKQAKHLIEPSGIPMPHPLPVSRTMATSGQTSWQGSATRLASRCCCLAGTSHLSGQGPSGCATSGAKLMEWSAWSVGE